MTRALFAALGAVQALADAIREEKMSDKKTPTEKAEAYTEAHAHTDYNYHTEDNINSYLAGHAEGRREALEMAQGLVDALRNSLAALASGYSPQQDAGQVVYNTARISAVEALAQFEAWREGK